jgi:cytidylate kinase
MQHSFLGRNVHAILGSVGSVSVSSRVDAHGQPVLPNVPFITLSRQPGAGAWKLAQEFVAVMNAAHPEGPPWTFWDRELVEKVAIDHKLSTRLIESLDMAKPSWLADLFGGLSSREQHEDLKVYHRVAQTIRALAQAGRVVIVGRGGVFATRDMPAGISLRLVAPLESRIASIGQDNKLSRDAATRWVKDHEQQRATFYHRFWPGKTLDPEHFTLTINTARVTTAEMVTLLRNLVEPRVAAETAPSAERVAAAAAAH